MLVISRKPGERVFLGRDIAVTLLEIRGNRVVVGIEAPATVQILREELAEWLDRKHLGADTSEDEKAQGKLPDANWK